MSPMISPETRATLMGGEVVVRKLPPNCAELPELAVRTCAFVLVVTLALATGSTVAAAESHSCTLEFQNPGQPNDNVTESIVVQRLQAAWNADDASAALALFADDAVAASSSGSRWEGKPELAAFLNSMWDPNYSSRISHVESTGLCVTAGRALWLFTYSETGATGSVDMSVKGARIDRIFWVFTPAVVARQFPSGPAPGIFATRMSLGNGVAFVGALGGFLWAIGRMRWQGRGAGERTSRRGGQMLCALREARLDRGTRDSGAD